MELRLISTAELAEVLGTTPGAIRVARMKGFGPKYIKVTKNVLYEWDDVIDWIDQNKHNPEKRKEKEKTPSINLFTFT